MQQKLLPTDGDSSLVIAGSHSISSDAGSSDKENDDEDNQSERTARGRQEECKDTAPEEDPLDEEEVQLLGEKASAGDSGELDLHREIGDRWQVWSQDGLKKDKKQELLEEYPRKGKFHFEAPALNPEVEAIISESVKKRDKYFCIDQNTIGSAISALGAGTSLLLRHKTEENYRTKVLKCCLDAGKLLSELYYQLSKTRKAFIYPGLDKKAKEILEKSKTDTLLFGNELSTRLKTAKSMEKVGLTLKPQPVVKKPPFKPSSSGNWKAPSGKNQGYSQAGYKSKGYRHRGSQHSRYQQDRGHASAPRPQSQTWPRDNSQPASQK